MIRPILRLASHPVVFLLKPIKLFAWRTRFGFLKRLILTATTPVDFTLIWLNVQNETMLLHAKLYRGNFLFGRGVMVTDYSTTAAAIARPALRGNNFMGVSIVSSDPNAFATNGGILNQCPPVRTATRAYLDANVFTPHVRAHDLDSVGADCREILEQWGREPEMATSTAIRATVTQVFLKVLAGKDVPRPVAVSATRQYIRRFVELSLFSGYLPIVCDLLGTQKAIRKDAYFPLKDHGIDLMTVDITLFAAMFSIGTLVLRCVEDTQRFGIDYRALDGRAKRRFVIEAVRLYPTVTSVHRIVERDEEVRVCGKAIRLTAGDEVVYPFVCSNRDPARFRDPEAMDLDRPDGDYDAVLSWSGGPHACPARELSILVTILMLDELSRRTPLRDLRIWNPAF